MAGRTHVEIFFVFADPSLQPCFASDGVWIEALRFLFDNSSVSGVQTMPAAMEKVTQCCFELPNHKYDVTQGAPAYGGASGTFHLKITLIIRWVLLVVRQRALSALLVQRRP